LKFLIFPQRVDFVVIFPFEKVSSVSKTKIKKKTTGIAFEVNPCTTSGIPGII